MRLALEFVARLLLDEKRSDDNDKWLSSKICCQLMSDVDRSR